MKKMIVLGLFLCGFAYAGLVNGIALVVNNEPITLYEIDVTAQKLKVSKKEAIEYLIDEKIHSSEIKRQGIDVDIYEIEERMASVAGSNSLTLAEFKEILASKFISLEEYKESLKKKLIQEKLARKIFSEESTAVDREDARIYYDNNQEEFAVPTRVKITKYAAKDQRELAAYLRNPMIVNHSVAVESEEIKTDELNPKLLSLVLETSEGEFTPIIPVGNALFVSIRIDAKLQKNQKSFDEVESAIAAKLSQQNEAKAIERYFKKQRAGAKIVEVRLP
jgi:parvulin-like peptidyl-prolyl isomerase